MGANRLLTTGRREVAQLEQERLAGGNQEASRSELLPVGEVDQVAADIGMKVGGRSMDDLAPVALHLQPADGQQFARRNTVAGEVAMQVGGRGIAGRTSVHHDHVAPGASENQGGGQAGGTSADDGYVVLTHVPRVGSGVRITYERCCLWESGVR